MKENVNMMVLEVKAKSEIYFYGLDKYLNLSFLVRIYFRHRTNYSHSNIMIITLYHHIIQDNTI